MEVELDNDLVDGFKIKKKNNNVQNLPNLMNS